MKIQIMSDIHLEFEDYRIEQTNADIVVLAGDIGVGLQGVNWAIETIDRPVVYVFGNHEYYRHDWSSLIADAKARAAGSHVHVLENDVVDFGDIRIFGTALWTDYLLLGPGSVEKSQIECIARMADYRLISAGDKRLTPQMTIDKHVESLSWLSRALAESDKKNIVVSHHAPSMQSVPIRYRDSLLTPAFATDLEAFISSNKIAHWIHGHMHDSCSYQVAQTKVHCNPRGYPNEEGPTFNPSYLLSV